MAPENTLISFRIGKEKGADGIELDTKLTRDGEVVVMHDQTVDRTTNGHGAVHQLRLEEILKLDAGSWMGSEFEGERVPTLANVFETFGTSLRYDVELTNYFSPADGLPTRVLELVRRYRVEDVVLVSSFYPSNLVQFRRLCPQIIGGLIAMGGRVGSISRSWFGRWFAPRLVVPYFKDLNPRFIKAQKSSQRLVYAWTVNGEEDMRKTISMGVDALISDVPDRARALLDEMYIAP